jgi:hypothetical protein
MNFPFCAPHMSPFLAGYTLHPFFIGTIVFVIVKKDKTKPFFLI